MQASNLHSIPLHTAQDPQIQEKFLATVKKFTQFVFKQERYCHNNGLPMALYRGQTQKWPLLPCILRDKIKTMHAKAETMRENERLQFIIKKEAQFLLIFKQEASAMINRPLTNQQWYYLAQHHGLPTRLLDWTRNPRVALWFAVQGDDWKPGYIYSFNRSQYNHRQKDCTSSYPNHTTIYEREKEDLFYGSIIGEGDKPSSEAPREKLLKIYNGDILLIDPDSYNERQSRQSSMFTLHLPDFSKTEEYYTDSSIIKENNLLQATLEIQPEEKTIFRTWLTLEGMREWDIFPDLDHLTKGIISEHTYPEDEPTAQPS